MWKYREDALWPGTGYLGGNSRFHELTLLSNFRINKLQIWVNYSKTFASPNSSGGSCDFPGLCCVTAWKFVLEEGKEKGKTNFSLSGTPRYLCCYLNGSDAPHFNLRPVVRLAQPFCSPQVIRKFGKV